MVCCVYFVGVGLLAGVDSLLGAGFGKYKHPRFSDTGYHFFSFAERSGSQLFQRNLRIYGLKAVLWVAALIALLPVFPALCL